jgi:hypothetical protein
MTNLLLRRIRGGLTTEQIASLPLEIQKARLRYIHDTDEELEVCERASAPKRASVNVLFDSGWTIPAAGA